MHTQLINAIFIVLMMSNFDSIDAAVSLIFELIQKKKKKCKLKMIPPHNLLNIVSFCIFFVSSKDDDETN